MVRLWRLQSHLDPAATAPQQAAPCLREDCRYEPTAAWAAALRGWQSELVGGTIRPVVMKWIVPVALVLLGSCGGGASTSRSAVSPILSGDLCAVHQDSTSCRADTQGCNWYPNTRACQVGAPCPAGWCFNPLTFDGGTLGDGGVAASAGCACPGAGGDACVEEIGGPAVQAQPSITCESVPASCALHDRCGCLSNSTLGTCTASQQVTNLCTCDNGIR